MGRTLWTASILMAAVMAASFAVSCGKKPAASSAPSIINTANTGPAVQREKDPELGDYLLELTVYEGAGKERNEQWEQHYRIRTDYSLEMYGIFNGKRYSGKKIGVSQNQYWAIYDYLKANPLSGQSISVYMNNPDGWVRNLNTYDKEGKVKDKIGGTMASGEAFDKLCEMILALPSEEERSAFISNVQTSVNKDYYVG